MGGYYPNGLFLFIDTPLLLSYNQPHDVSIRTSAKSLTANQRHSPSNIDEIEIILREMGFTDARGSARCLDRLIREPGQQACFVHFAPQLFSTLLTSGNPDRVLAALERFIHSTGDTQSIYQFFASHPRAVELLVRLFSGSQFLGEILLRNPENLEMLLDRHRLTQIKTYNMLYLEACEAVNPYHTSEDKLDGLRRFQRIEMLRIGASDLFYFFDMQAATKQLSILADCLIESCLEIAAEQVGVRAENLAVIGMGKLGGQELNYSSDIDFLFLGNEITPGITRLGERLIDGLARVTTEGFLYRVDMRLRPWGGVGPLVSSLDGFITYLSRNALLWEKQALLKARVVAGDRQLGGEFLRQVMPYVLSAPSESVRADVYALKQRTEQFVEQQNSGAADVKLGEGSIRDVEFAIQYLQLVHGKQKPEILSANTLEALSLCMKAKVINAREYRILSGGYIFLRTIEHHLQMMDYRQTHTLPEDPHDIQSLAHRLGFDGGGAGDAFLARYKSHSAAIREIYLRYVGRIDLKNTNLSPQDPQQDDHLAGSFPEVAQHVERMSASYQERFTKEDISRHAALAGQLNEDRLAVVDEHPLTNGTWEVSIVAYDYPGELSLICGLLFVHGLDIIKGDAFTYEPASSPKFSSEIRKIVDVFTVRPVRVPMLEPGFWLQISTDLASLLRMVRSGQPREARSELTKRVGALLFETSHSSQGDLPRKLYPISIQIDNDSSDQYTLLRISTTDTVGFLYEFTNALAMEKIYIARVIINSVGSQVNDILYVTDENSKKITDPGRQRELRAATVLVKHFTHLLPSSPNPESALFHFREFIAQLFKRPNWPDELGSLERPEVLQAIAQLLGVSDFLWDDFLRMQYANLFPVVTGVDTLSTAKSKIQLENELAIILSQIHSGPQAPAENAPWREAVNSFKDREMFRIDMRHILGHTSEFWEFASELSDLAEILINVVYHLCHEDLRSVYGSPLLENGEISEMSVCALGKCGGRELGFASDIELMFVYSGNGMTTGPQVITTTEFYEKLVQDFVRTIRAKREGIFEIDLQLRPYGKAGSLSVSLDSFRKYFALAGPAWPYERQALVKLRPVAGNRNLGETIVGLRDSFVYTGEPFDVTAMRAMRERQLRHLVAGGVFNLKYSPGGLVDVEYLVQGLLINYGYELSQIRQPNTRDAMAALAEAGILSDDDYSRLRKAHTFLRWMIELTASRPRKCKRHNGSD